MIILNLGCGTKTSDNENIVNIDWSVSLRIYNNPILRLFLPILMNKDRRERSEKLAGNIRVYNLAKGIPYPDNSIDAVYHSHLLEHINRNQVEAFLLENFRVLKKNGILRIVVPDFELLCREYIEMIDKGMKTSLEEHEIYIENIIEQSVRTEAHGTSQQTQPRRFIENLLLGDARKRGETHQWMYDKTSLPKILCKIGFNDVQVKDFNDSSIPNWNEIGLDLNEQKQQYKPNSLYVEAKK